MVNLLTSHLEGGETLAEDVHTALGNTLFHKGKVLSEKELTILKAFQIHTVVVKLKKGTTASVQLLEGEIDRTPSNLNEKFHERYQILLKQLKRYFYNASSGITPPLLDLRTELERLITHIDQFEMITFAPRHKMEEDYLYHKSITVSLSSYKLAQWSNANKKDWIPIAMGGLLHDIGMIKMDEDIIRKKTTLTTTDLEQIKKHTAIGYNMLRNVAGINEGVKLCALQHHERMDGSGYPLKLTGDRIHEYAKIVAIADIYHAMSNDRIYKKGVSPYLVLEELMQASFGKLDPFLVQSFVHHITAFQNGSHVRLSNQQIGVIVFSERTAPTRPLVKVNGKIINLTVERDLYITEVIKE